MAELHFLRPWWLLGAVLCFVMAVALRRRASGRTAWRQVIDPKLAPALIRQHAGRGSWGAIETIGLMLAIGMLALSGPSWNKQLPDELKDEAAVIVILANGNSMYAGDIAPNRNRAAKEKIQALRRLMPQSSFGVIAYADTAHLVIPLTRDDGFFDLFLPPLEPDIMPRSALGRSGLEQALDLAQQTAATASVPVNVIVMTDSLSEQDPLDLIRFREQRPALEVLVVGSGNGGGLRFAPAGVSPETTQVPVDEFVSLKNEGVPVITITPDGQDLAWLAQHVRGTLVQAQKEDPRWQWRDSGYWLVLAMLPLGFLLYRQVTALSILAPLMLLLAGAYSPDAHAGWQDLWWTPDQLGQQALEEGDYKRAATLFSDGYRKGRAYYLDGNYAAATAAFRQVHSAEGYFYLANSLARQQQFHSALKYYELALQAEPGLEQASANAKKVKAVLDELARKPGTREKQDGDNNDYSSIRIELDANRSKEEGGPAGQQAMSAEELKHWMSNVRTSPKDMLRALFLLQAQARQQQEQE
ncbi:Tetratricopeptide repeat protein [compost metagenome]